MTTQIILTGLLIFGAEVAALTLGTVRTIVTVLGETRTAFVLGTFEMLIWTAGTAAVMMKISEVPFYGLCYALGFGCGNVVGILAERRLALGNVIIRIISASESGQLIASEVRRLGYSTTTMPGEGGDGPVSIQFIVCRRKDMKGLVDRVMQLDPNIFYTYDLASGANKVQRPFRQPVGKKALRPFLGKNARLSLRLGKAS